MWREFVDLIFPNLCLSCQNNLQFGENTICMACLVDLPTALNSLSNGSITSHQLVYLKDIKFLYEFSKQGKVQEILHQIKYNKKPKAAVELGKMLGKVFINDIDSWKIDAFVPIAVHPKRLEERGYNQSEMLTNGTIETVNRGQKLLALQRIKNSGSQTKMNKEQRYKNVQDAFIVNPKIDIKEKTICLIDDVATTLATLEVCAQKLLHAGAKNVYAITLAGVS